MTMNNDSPLSGTFADKAATTAKSLAEFDEATYRPHLDGLDLSDEQKSEFLHLLWNIMRGMIELNAPPELWGANRRLAHRVARRFGCRDRLTS